MQERDDKILYLRVDREFAESINIMASVLGLTSAEYMRQAVEARLSEDVPDNITAYNAIRQARERQQQKGA